MPGTQRLSGTMKAFLVTFGSMLLTAGVLGNAYFQKKQFYPSVVYLTKSNPSMAVIYLQAFVLVLLMGKLMRKVFFGQLRAAEMEHLIERSWYAVTETCLAFTVFRDDLSPKFVAFFTLLLFLKCFHWLAEDRVDYMERSPNISVLFHIRVISLLCLLGSLDFLFVNLAYYSTLTKGASVQLVFGFEYAILFTVVLNIVMKYALHFADLQRENPWEDKAVYLLYTELVMGFLKVVLYLTFITIMMKIHTFPLFAIRPMYLSMRAFKKALNDVIMSRRAIRNMNTLYPNATPEELATVDNVCIICREEMTGNGSAKKLPCNHIFHVSCLRSWFQRQQTCPTCRMDVLRIPQPTAQPQQQQPQAPPAAGPFVVQGNWQNFIANFVQQQNAQQQPRPQPGINLNNNNNNNNLNNFNNYSAANQGGQQMPAFMGFMPFMPPFGPIPPMPPIPTPPVDLGRLTIEELRSMEGNERENIESRIRCLQNIRTLLDAAVFQLQQYNSIINNLSSNIPNDPQAPSPGVSRQQQQPSSNEQNNSSPQEASTSAAADLLNPQEEIRRIRLQRFSHTQPPIIDPKTGQVIGTGNESEKSSSPTSNLASTSQSPEAEVTQITTENDSSLNKSPSQETKKNN